MEMNKTRPHLEHSDSSIRSLSASAPRRAYLLQVQEVSELEGKCIVSGTQRQKSRRKRYVQYTGEMLGWYSAHPDSILDRIEAENW